MKFGENLNKLKFEQFPASPRILILKLIFEFLDFGLKLLNEC